jgi:putative CocE/NonD family hydrolase
VTGHPIVHLFAESTARDGAVHAYLEDVDPGGRVTLVTEGHLRLLHRKLSEARPPYRSAVPYRSYEKADAAPMEQGEIAELCFDLLPISYVFFAGHSLRVAIAGADRDHFAPIAPGAPTLRFHCGGVYPARIELPVAAR